MLRNHLLILIFVFSKPSAYIVQASQLQGLCGASGGFNEGWGRGWSGVGALQLGPATPLLGPCSLFLSAGHNALWYKLLLWMLSSCVFCHKFNCIMLSARLFGRKLAALFSARSPWKGLKKQAQCFLIISAPIKVSSWVPFASRISFLVPLVIDVTCRRLYFTENDLKCFYQGLSNERSCRNDVWVWWVWTRVRICLGPPGTRGNT